MSTQMNIFLHDLLRCNSSKSIDLISDNACATSPAPSASLSLRGTQSSDDEFSISGEEPSLKLSLSEPELSSMQTQLEFDTPLRRRRNSDPSDSRKNSPRQGKQIPVRPSPVILKGLFCPGVENLATDRNRVMRLASSLPKELSN